MTDPVVEPLMYALKTLRERCIAAGLHGLIPDILHIMSLVPLDTVRDAVPDCPTCAHPAHADRCRQCGCLTFVRGVPKIDTARDAVPEPSLNSKCACGHWRYGDAPNSGHLPGDGLCTVSLGDEWCPCMGFRAALTTEDSDA
jgi:hypothetical protein